MLRSARTIELFPAVQKFILTGLGYLLILYIISFLIFAVIRVLTGVSIKRLGYFSLRHISFAPKPGIQVSIGRVGLSLHRPTVARPGWVSLLMSNLDLTIDPKVVLHPDYLSTNKTPTGLSNETENPEGQSTEKSGEKDDPTKDDDANNSNNNDDVWSFIPPKTYAFYVVRFILKYAKYFDFAAAGTSLTYTGVGTIIVGNFSLKIDLRNIMGSMKNNFVGTLETRRKLRKDETTAICRLMVQDFYMAEGLEDEDPREFLDTFGLDVGGVLGTQDLSVKDLSLAFKLGKAIFYVDRILQMLGNVRRIRKELAQQSKSHSRKSSQFAKVLSDGDVHNLTRTGTLLVRVVKEVEIKATYLGIFGIPSASPTTAFAASAKDLSLDTRRLNPQSPGFKLFFSEGDSAHQAIFTMSSVSLGVDAKRGGHQDELAYVPMVTMISKTNIFSKTLQFVRDTNTKTNESIFRANVNITSPTVDLEAFHVPVVLESLIGTSSKNDDRISHTAKSFQRLWPRAVIKFTIDEPAARLLLSSQNATTGGQRSMVISSSSKIHCDFESSHSNDPENPAYSSHASLQVTQYDTWYRSPSGTRYDVFLSENLLLKINAVVDPTISVTISGILSNAHVLLTKSEVFRGIREFCLHIRKSPKPQSDKKNSNILHNLPPWLSRLKIEIADTAVSVASEEHQDDNDVVRGLTMQMSNSVVEYRSDKEKRKLAMIMEGIEGYKIIEKYELEKNAQNQFMQIPSLSVAVGAETPSQLQCNVIMKNALVTYDVNLHFLGLLSAGLLAHTLALDSQKAPKSPSEVFFGLHVKTGNIRLRVELPNDARIMLETNALELQRKKDYRPRMRAKAIRMYSSHPNVPNAWGRIISLRGAHADFKAKDDADHLINLSFDGMRLNVPSQYIFHKVLDNMVTAFKATVNLQARYKTGDEMYEAVSKPKERSKMPNIPKIRIKTPALLVSLEDDHFESQLGLIFQVGLREQKIRLEKERAFEAKVAALKKPTPPPKQQHQHQYQRPSLARRTSNNSQMSSGSSVSDLQPVDEEQDQDENMFSEDQDNDKHHHHLPKRPTLMSFHHGHNRHTHQHQHHSHRKRYHITTNDSHSSESKVSVEDAREKLLENFSKSWIWAFNEALKSQKAAVRQNIENCWGVDEIDPETAADERIVDYSEDPLMFFGLFKGVDLMLKKPAFNDHTLREFLHNVGKGLPMDSRFALLVPLFVDLKLSELRFQLRDYPLPLIHFPELHPTQDQSIPSVHISGNLVIAEELWTEEASIRRINVPLVPLNNGGTLDETTQLQKYIIEVVRTISSVKIYTELKTRVNTNNPTRIAWANSMQPAIQTVMLAFDSFSKPPIDPSPKLGFWDKIRNMFHARIRLDWSEGDVFLFLKGSRSPYDLLGNGAGFVMGWRNNVSLTVNGSDNPKELLVADSEEYILAVPNFVAQERDYLKKASSFQHAIIPKTNYDESTSFRKVVMKLSGRVKWMAGLLFEIDQANGKGRTSEFKPHYKLQLKKPSAIQDLNDYDAFSNFRSQYMHMAITVTSPQLDEGTSYNTVHLTPRVLYHFQHWWGLFGGSLSLPIRTGALFQPTIIKKPKFGRHLFTVKYQLLLNPLFISHTYRHPHSDDLTKHNKKASTGLKGKIDSFTMDLHQRREQEHGKRWRMKVHMAELDFASTDLRVLMAVFKEKSAQELLAKKLGVGQSISSPISNDASSTSATQSNSLPGQFKISDNDYTWIDMDDYIELDDSIPVKKMPKITVLPLLYSPRWTYFRQTDHSKSKMATTSSGAEYMKFGDEPAHDCLIGSSRPEAIQKSLLRQRVHEIDEQIKTDDATLDSLVKDLQEYPDETSIQQRVDSIKAEIESLAKRKEAILAVINSRRGSLNGDENALRGLEDLTNPRTNENSFNNRFIIHNVQLKWNNSVRNAIYRYLHKVGDRRAFTYFLTRRAVKYVEDLIQMSDGGDADTDSKVESDSASASLGGTYKEQVENLLHGIFKSDDTGSGGNSRVENFESELRHLTDNEGMEIDDTYLVRLTSPQIQFISDQNPDQCVLVTSQNMELKVLSVLDKDNDNDEVSALVETRYGVMLQDAQFFVLSRQDVSRGSVALFTSNNYGCSQMSSSWPPWLALEMCFESSPLKEQLVVDRTSATLRYDKPNSLRVQKLANAGNKNETFSSKVVRCEQYRANRIAVDFPKVVANCDSKQYFAVYTIVIDLLIYSEPSSQKTSENLEEVLLATDFSDLKGAVDRLNKLQTDIRQLEDIRNEFAIRMGDAFDEKTSEDLSKIEVEHYQVVLELMVMMRAIRTGIQKGHRDTSQMIKWVIAADQIIWHVLGTDRKPFLDIGLADASFNRIEGGDGFNSNTVEVGMMQGFNLLPNTLYPELFSPYLEENADLKRTTEKLIYVEWTMLDPIGGIPIVENFYIKLLPLKLQLEHDTGQKIFEYIFPSNEESPFLISRMGGAKKSSEESGDDGQGSSSGVGGVSFGSDSSDEESVYTGDSMDGASVVSSKASQKNLSLSGNGGGHGWHPVANRVLRKSSSFANSRATFNSSNRNHSFKWGNSGSGLRDISPTAETSSVVSSNRNRGTSFGNSGNKTSSIYSGSNARSIRSGKRVSSHSEDGNGKEDDFQVMVKRASNYMSIVDIKIENTTMCISFKGHGSRNLTDIHEFVLRLPELEYKNKTWSNLDLALRLKKDVIKTLFQHTGALISNKFTRHRKKRVTLNQPLRQISNYVSFTSVADLTDPSNSNTKSPKPSQSTPATPPNKRAKPIGASSSTSTPRIEITSASASASEASLRNTSASNEGTNRSTHSSPIIAPVQELTSVSTSSSATSGSGSGSGGQTTSSPQSGLRSRATSFVKGIVGSNSSSSSSSRNAPNGEQDISEEAVVQGETSIKSGYRTPPNLPSTANTLPPSPLHNVQRIMSASTATTNSDQETDSEQGWSNSDDLMESSSEDDDNHDDSNQLTMDARPGVNIPSVPTSSQSRQNKPSLPQGSPEKRKKKGFFKFRNS